MVERMKITPLILGRGRAGEAIAKSLLNLSVLYPEFEIQTPIGLERGADLAVEHKKYAHPLLCISNPHGLHADSILAGAKAGFEAMICEKPACVNLEQLQKLREVKSAVAVLHVYRAMWGLQHLKQMIDDGGFGQIITIEGRYWQPSTAERALTESGISSSWKNDTRLGGESDTFLDIATHWVDAVSFLYGSLPLSIEGWKTNLNSETAHRDSHVQLVLQFKDGGRGFGSISKTVHGSSNHFEVNVLGTKKSATWEFLKPDQLAVGIGRDLHIITRKTSDLGSKQAPFHGLGWLEGYMEIGHQLMREVYQGKTAVYPRLKDNLDLLEVMLKTNWSA